jgi:hypothetical protein
MVSGLPELIADVTIAAMSVGALTVGTLNEVGNG